MADCKVIYNSNNEKIGVEDANGQSSILFQEILNNSQVKNFDEALEIYKQTLSPKLKQRVADQLPLTLQVFERPEFKALQGKQVNPITVLNSLNQSGVKQIERDLIKQVIEDNYKGQNKVDYDELEATVRANIIPLERITTSSYADYGMDNLGNGDYGEAKTIIFNAPIEHGVTGHFSGDFKASGRQNIKYVPKQLNDNTWVAVEEGYESQANNNNIYQYVGTAGTKEAVDAWILDYNNTGLGEYNKYDYSIKKDSETPSQIIYNVNILYINSGEEVFNRGYLVGSPKDNPKSEEDIKKEAYTGMKGASDVPNINKGMFGHIRVWEDGEVFTVAELQSDYFQKNNTRKEILEKNKDYIKNRRNKETNISNANVRRDEAIIKLNSQNYSITTINGIIKVQKKLNSFGLPIGDTTGVKIINTDNGFTIEKDGKILEGNYYLKQDTAERDLIKWANEGNYDKIKNTPEVVKEGLPTNLIDSYDYLKDGYQKEINKIEKEFLVTTENIIKNLSPQEKQFIASQKIWEQRMVREAIKEAALSGATQLRFPTPYTLSVIEGYVSTERDGMPYEVTDADDFNNLSVGNYIEHAGDEYIVVDAGTGNNIYVRSLISSQNQGQTPQDFKEEYNIDPKPYSLEKIEKEDLLYFYDENRGTIYTWWDDNNQESFGQPSTYKSKQNKNKYNFSIEEDLSDTQQTVARKYEEIAQILEKEKPTEIVTDENGFDWYEAKITQEDTQSPVVAFSLNTQEPSLKYQTKDGQIYQSYEEALKNTQGGDIFIGVNTVDGFKEVFLASSNTNIDTTEGFVNNIVKSDLLTGESYKENGKTHYKAQGKSFTKQKINAENVKDLYQKQFGIKSATINADNTVTINGEETHRNNVQITTKNGEQKVVSLSELNRPFSELKKEYDVETTSSILANNELKNAMARNKTVKEEFIPETELQQKLINLLKKFGIKTLSFEDYLKNYNKRNNLPISARALVDLTEKIIAFKDGIIENDDLVEEVAHLIESSIPMEQKENSLRNIHKTQEWMQFAEEYSKIYETEQEVRREVLGKVIANSIKEQFANRNTNETENNIIAKIKQFFEDFFNRINSYFKESYKRELESISKNVYKNLMSETLDLDIQQKGIFFSTGNASTKSTKIYNTANKILSKLSEQHRELSKKYSNPSDKVLLERTKEYLEAEDEATKIKGIASLIRVTSSQVETLLSATENKAEGEYPLSSEENVIFKNLEDRVRPSLAEVKVLLDPKDKFQAEIIEELSNTTKKLENLVGIVKSKIGLSLDRMVDNIVQRAEMSDKDANLYRRTIKNALVDAQKDTDWLHAHIGSLLLARNPILNIAGNIIERMNYQKNENFLKPTKELTNFLAENNFTQKDWEKIIKDGYIINELDQNLVEKVDKEEKAKIINELISKNTPSIKPVTDQTDFKTYFENLQNEFDKGVVGGLLTSLNQDDISNLQSLYRKSWKNNLKTRTERYFTDSYTKALENHTVELQDGSFLNLKEIGINARDLDDQYKADTTQIRINAGKNLTKSDQAKIKEINKRRQADSNPRGIDGNLLPGIREVYDSNLGRYIVELDQYKQGQLEETDTWKSLSEQEKENVRTIVDLNLLSIIKQDFYKKSNQGKEIPDSFIAELSKLTTTEEKLEFLENNSYIGFPDEYYEGFKDNAGIVSRLREEGSQEALDIIDSIRTQQAIINRILRINSVFNKPSETNFVEMNEVHKNDIKLAQISLEKLYNDAKSVLPKKDVEEIESSIDNVVNESYYNHLRDSGENELEFISKNVTPSGLVAIETAKKVVAGERTIPKGFSNYFSENMSQEEKQRALIKFAQSKLLPYLKRTEPKGYTEVLQDVKAGRITVEDFIKRTDVVKVSPSFSFYEGIDDNINKQWIKNRDNNKPQWTKDYLKKVANKEYFSFFNLDENGNRSPLETKNKKYWDAREKILEYQDKMIEYNNLTGVQNRYMQPQVRRTDMERVAGTTVKGVKEFFVDMAQFRPEEQETGKMLSDSLHSIPTYYNKPLEEKEELTKNYLYAYMMYGQAASLHKARKENISDMFIIEDVLTASSFENKATESTMAYKMFKNFMEYNFYGVKENFSLEFKAGDRTLDVGKILKSMNSWAKKSNLAGLTVPITNLFQSGTQKFMERVIGETIDSKSANEGNKLFMKYASDATKEVMGFNSKSPLNVIGESLGIYNAVHRFEDSQYSKPVRFLMSANAKLHEAANFPIVMRGVMGIISSYKIVDGKIISYNQFKQKMNALNKKGDIDSEWAKYEAFAPDFISAVKNGVLDFSDPDFLKRMEKKIIPPPNVSLEDYLNDKKIAISVKSLSFIQRIDSQIPMHQKSIAQRDARANFFLSHLGFLLSAIPQRIRSRHYNIAEEAMQEGSWITAKDFLAKIISNPKGYREVYESLDENQKKNLKRVLVELGFANALAFMALMLSRYNDDSDEVLFPAAIADLFLTRVATEQISSTVGLPTTISKLTENPLMIATKVKDWSRLDKLFGDSEERSSYLNKLVPFYKEIDKFSDPIGTRQKYVHFQANDESLFYNYAWSSRYFKEDK